MRIWVSRFWNGGKQRGLTHMLECPFSQVTITFTFIVRDIKTATLRKETLRKLVIFPFSVTFS